MLNEEANTANWLNSQGFVNVQAGNYWSSTGGAWGVDLSSGRLLSDNSDSPFGIWPVRSGQ